MEEEERLPLIVLVVTLNLEVGDSLLLLQVMTPLEVVEIVDCIVRAVVVNELEVEVDVWCCYY